MIQYFSHLYIRSFVKKGVNKNTSNKYITVIINHFVENPVLAYVKPNNIATITTIALNGSIPSLLVLSSEAHLPHLRDL